MGELTTTQKIVGGALLAAGIGYLATRKSASKDDNKPKSRYGRQSGSNYGRQLRLPSPRCFQQPPHQRGSGRTDSGSAYGNSTTPSYGTGTNTGSGFGSIAIGQRCQRPDFQKRRLPQR